MTRLAEIEAQIASMSELLDLMGAMRSLAGMRVQEAQGVLPGVRRYAESMAAGIAGTLLFMPDLEPPPRQAQQRLALVLYVAEHGFVGGFNERLLDAAHALLGPNDALFVLGSRGAALAFERGCRASWTHAMATRCGAAPEAVQALTTELYRHIAQNEITRVELIHARFRQGNAAGIERCLLLPLDLVSLRAKQPRQPPLHNLSPVALHERLVGEYVFALLTEAAVESIAGENAARLATMESARDNVSKKLETLQRDAHQARQAEITTEILVLVAATQALENKGR
jgi:F-type H+-transporting ATPase subunit gamma